MSVSVTCERIRSLASAYRDGALAPASADAVRNHLDGCEDCRAEVDSYRLLAQGVRELPCSGLSADFLDRVRSSHDEAARTQRFRSPRSAWPSRIAAAILVALSLGFAYNLGRLQNEGAPRDEQRGGRTEARHASTWEALGAESFDPARFVRGTRALARDVAVMDRLQPELRRPVVASQLRFLDLEGQARSWHQLREHRGNGHPTLDLAAEFVDQLSERMRAAHSREVNLPREMAMTLLKRLPGKPPRPRSAYHSPLSPDDRVRLLAEMAPELPETMRSRIVDFLAVRESWIEGELSLGLERARKLHLRKFPTDSLEVLEIPMLLHSLIQVGRTREFTELLPQFRSFPNLDDLHIEMKEKGIKMHIMIRGDLPMPGSKPAPSSRTQPPR